MYRTTTAERWTGDDDRHRPIVLLLSVGDAPILIHDALEDARHRGLTVLPFYPFVNEYVERHREYVELVPESRREGFGL